MRKFNILIEYRRPWKLISLCLGVGILVWGSFYVRAPDWDISISIIMAFFAYLTSAWSLRTLVERRWKCIPLALFFTWFSIDGCYWLYWTWKDPTALAMMRDVNFLASLVLYGICGLIWYYNGSLREIVSEVKAIRIGHLKAGRNEKID